MSGIVKYIKSLQNKKIRAQENRFIVEGIRAVEELLKTPGTGFKAVYTAELEQNRRGKLLLDNLEKKNIETYLVSQREMEQLSECDTPSGVLAAVKAREYTLADMLEQPQPFLLILDEIQDPGNLGTIIRTAEAAGVNGIIISRDSVDPHNSKVVRASMGSILRMPVVRDSNMNKLLALLKTKKIRIIASDLNSRQYYYQANWDLPLALVLGNEGAGLSREILEQADETVKIPQKRSVESLNVAVASAIIMYQVVEKSKKRIADGV